MTKLPNPAVGIEYERNIVCDDGKPFLDLQYIPQFWERFATKYHGKLKNDVSSKKPIGVQEFHLGEKSYDLLNDTGYYEIEYPSQIYFDLNEAQADFNKVFAATQETLQELVPEKIRLLGTGSHPFLEATPENYFKYRTPKGHLYSILCEGSQFLKGRNWQHYMYLTVTSDQTNIDLPDGDEHKVMLTINRLMGLLISMSANSPFENGKFSGYKSLRQAKQYKMLSTSRAEVDRTMVGMLAEEPESYEWYFQKIFNERPIIFQGADKGGELCVPLKENDMPPTFTEFISKKQWNAVNIEGEKNVITPKPEDIQSPLHRISFWNLKPQLNFSRAADISIEEFLQAAREKNIYKLFKTKNVNLYTEVRAIDSALPGRELAMPALIKGLVSNHEKAHQFAFQKKLQYSDWQEIYQLAAKHGMEWSHNGTSAQQYCQELLEIAKAGLQENEASFLKPIEENIRLNRCPADYCLETLESQGWQATIDLLTIKPSNDHQ